MFEFSIGTILFSVFANVPDLEYFIFSAYIMKN